MSRRNILLIAGAAIGLGLILIVGAFAMSGFNKEKLGTVDKVSKTYEITEPFSAVDIQTLSCDVSFVLASDGKTRIESVHSAEINESAGVENGVLTLRQESKQRVRFGVDLGEDRVTVYLAESDYRELTVQTSSGGVNVGEAFAFDRIKLGASSGDIRCTAQCRESLAIETSSGEIDAGGAAPGSASFSSTSGEVELEDLTVSGPLSVSTSSGGISLERCAADGMALGASSGDVELEDVTVHGALSVDTSSGEVELKRCQAGSLTVETTSGDVSLERSDAGEIGIETSSGGVKGTLLGGKDFQVRTTSGTVSVPESTPGAGTCKISTTSGDVTLRVG